MKKCNSCSSIIPDSEVFCPKCGSKRFTPVADEVPKKPVPVIVEDEDEDADEEDTLDFADDTDEEEEAKKGKKVKKEKPKKEPKSKKEPKQKKEKTKKEPKQPKPKPEGPPPDGPATMGEYLKFLLWAFLPLAGPIVMLVNSIKASRASEWMNPSLVNLGKAGIVYSIILLLLEITLTVLIILLFVYYIMI